MSRLHRLANDAQDVLDSFRALDFLAPLLIRLYLVPVFWVAGMNKLHGFDDVVLWFGPDGLDLPLPWLMAAMATATELAGAVLLLFGLAVRWISIPLMVTMLVAIFAVHLENGWYAIAQGADPGVAERLERARGLLQEYGNYDWLTEKGNFVILQNGIEFAATYFILLLTLFFIGAGRWVSVDHWISGSCRGRAV
ncbi:MAG: DoxX family protein [Pseudomonadota bacterium]